MWTTSATTFGWFSDKARFIQETGKALFHLILPPRCLSCNELVANQGGLCSTCFSDLALIEDPVCARTGRPLAYDLGEEIISAEAHSQSLSFRKMRAAARYEGTARKLVLSFKFHDRLDLAKPLARLMIRAGHELVKDADILVPVPLHRQRLFQRRFNQAGELVKEIARQSGKPHALRALKRIRPTRQQTRLDHHERVKNVAGAFRVAGEEATKVHGRRVLLVDDVMTTGATVNACVRALLREQATHVDVITFAKVVESGEITI